MNRTIVHVDMDAFFAAVEVRDNPELAGKPLIIGALPSERGVVSTCSYEARKYGVRSAMSIKEAYRRCPHGVYMHPNGRKYAEASRRAREIWDSYTDLVEQVSIDEAYLDVTGSMHLYGGARRIGQEIRRRTKEELGLTCSVGIGYAMMAAKLASEEKKPDGFFEILTPGDFAALIVDREVRVLSGVGVKTAEALNRAGFRTVRDLVQRRDAVLRLFGSHGEALLDAADGRDDRRVTPYSDPKSIGKEHTFQHDTTDFDFLRDSLLLIARELGYDIREKGFYASTVTLKITYANMKQITRAKTGPATNRSGDIYRAASSLLDAIERQPIRLIGISLGGLSRTRVVQPSLVDPPSGERKEQADAVAFELMKRFGRNSIKTAGELKAEKRFTGDE